MRIEGHKFDSWWWERVGVREASAAAFHPRICLNAGTSAATTVVQLLVRGTGIARRSCWTIASDK
eukprot:6179371-Pleurochrysis_carterae.AAC.1